MARFSESPHQVQIILILRDFLRDFTTRCVKRSRPQATEYPGASLQIAILESLAYGRLSKINILADKPIPAERSEGPGEQSGLRGGGIAPGGMPPVDHPGGP